MGVDVATPAPSLTGRAADWTRSPRTLRLFALLSVIVSVGIVITGGAVRLTDSGLGCPTWPRCVGSSLVPRERLGVNGAIEFTNRTLTFVVGIVLLATLVVAWRQRRHVRLAALAFAGVPAQALLGGVVVLTDLNPWLVAAHFLLSAAIIAATYVLWWRAADRAGVGAPRPVRLLATALTSVTALVLVAGSIVTGTGPHAGDLEHGTIKRIDLPITGVTQLHADLVMVLIGLTLGVVAAGWTIGSHRLRQAGLVLLAVELAQGAIGYTQYFLNVPPLLVGFHMFGACLVWIATLQVLLTSAAPAQNS
jgi:cytochrome c oxidase assembly protein subunit 15